MSSDGGSTEAKLSRLLRASARLEQIDRIDYEWALQRVREVQRTSVSLSKTAILKATVKEKQVKALQGRIAKLVKEAQGLLNKVSPTTVMRSMQREGRYLEMLQEYVAIRDLIIAPLLNELLPSYDGEIEEDASCCVTEAIEQLEDEVNENE